jgi:hypothetical protein
MVNFRQPSHEFTFGVGMNFISYPLVLTPLDITSSFVHVGFGVWCLCRNLALEARLPSKVHQVPCDKTLKPGTSQAMKWAWLQEAQGLTREDGKLWGPEQKMLNLAGQRAPSKLQINWLQGPTCRRDNTLEDSRSITRKGGREMGRNGPRPVGPGCPAQPILGPIRCPFWPSRLSDYL